MNPHKLASLIWTAPVLAIAWLRDWWLNRTSEDTEVLRIIPADETHEAFYSGASARAQGRPRWDNPYSEQDWDMSRCWDRGWSAEDRMRKSGGYR